MPEGRFHTSNLSWDAADTAAGERQSAETYTTCTSMDAGWFHTLAMEARVWNECVSCSQWHRTVGLPCCGVPHPPEKPPVFLTKPQKNKKGVDLFWGIGHIES